MAQFVVRQMEDDIKTRLKRRAERHGRSLEAEVREILRNVAMEESRPIGGLGSRIAARFSQAGLPSNLPELKGQHPQALNLRG